MLFPQLFFLLMPFVVFCIWRWDAETAFVDRRLLDIQARNKTADGIFQALEQIEATLISEAEAAASTSLKEGTSSMWTAPVSTGLLDEPVSLLQVIFVFILVVLYVFACYVYVTMERQGMERRKIELFTKKNKVQ